jgi:hypothetical protein
MPEAAEPVTTTVSPDGPNPGPGPLPDEVGQDTFAQRPEVFVGAAFAGGFVLAQILKRVGR